MKTILSIILAFIFSTSFTWSQAKAKQADNIKTVSIKTTAQCGMCKDIIEKAMAFERGVKSSELDLKTKVLTVVYDGKRTTEVKLRTSVAKTGYDADDVRKDPKAYKNLPACCKLPTDPEYKGH